MNAVTAFAHRKDALRTQLDEAKDMQQAAAACTMALEQTACELAQDEQDEYARQRQQAVMALARRVPGMLQAARAKGEMVVSAEEGGSDPDRFGRGLQLCGVLALTGMAVYEYFCGRTAAAFAQVLGALAFAAGSMRLQAQRGEQAQARGVAYVDAQDAVLKLTQLCEAVDLCVSDLAQLECSSGHVRLSGTADDAMLDLLVALMEAKASGRDEVAMRSLTLAEEYLRMLGVEAASYSEETAAMFDTLPTIGAPRTVRPALVKDGRVMRRGVAAVAGAAVEGGAHA